MIVLKFNKELYPKEIVFVCAQDYAPYCHAAQTEDEPYLLYTFPEEEKGIAREFANYVLAAVRSHAV